MEWHNEYAPTCPNCKAMYAGRTPPGQPPCETCRVVLHPDNNEVISVFMKCRGQLIIGGMGQVIDLSIPAVKIVMDLLEVDDQGKCLDRIMRLFHHMMKRRDEKKE